MGVIKTTKQKLTASKTEQQNKFVQDIIAAIKTHQQNEEY